MSRIPRFSTDRMYASRFAAFTDHLLLGALVFVFSLPVVTWFAALSAGAGLSRDREEFDATISPRTYAARFRGILRAGPSVIVVPTLVVAVLVVDAIALHAGLGASRLATALILTCVTTVGVVALRSAALFTPGARWQAVVQKAWRLTGSDLRGSALLVGALATSVLVAAWVPPMVVVLAGPLCLAAAAITARQPVRRSAAPLTVPFITELRRNPS